MNNLLIISGLFTLSIGLSEIAYRLDYPNYISRSIGHIGGSLVSLLLPILLGLDTVVFVGLGFSILIFIGKELDLLKGLFKHNTESVGPILFPVGLTIAAVTFWGYLPIVFQTACLVLGFSDALAGMIGKTYGKIKYQLSAEKTVEGSLVFFVTTMIIFMSLILIYRIGFTPTRFGKLIIGSVILTIAEASFGNGWDNLILPFVSGFVAVWVYA
jgi:phytol kinase